MVPAATIAIIAILVRLQKDKSKKNVIDMDNKFNLSELIVYDFSNLNLQEESTWNCYSDCDGNGECDSDGDCDCDTYCDNCD